MPEDEIEQSAPTIDLLDERFAGELDVKLTKGQIVFLYNLYCIQNSHSLLL